MKSSNMIRDNIRHLREKEGLTQIEVANKIGVSRASYINLENKKSDSKIDIQTIERLSAIFNVSILDILSCKKGDAEKFREMIFYVLTKFKDGIPKTKLAKILYLIDFSWYYNKDESMSGFDYINRQYGPVADGYFEEIDELYNNGKIDVEYLDRGAIMIKLVSRPEFNKLIESEKEIINNICKVWKDIRTDVIVNFTHEQYPWKNTKNGDIIPYELIKNHNEDDVYIP